MIVRIWRGESTTSQADHYVRHFKENVLPELKAIDGHRGAYVLQCAQDDRVEF
jgi:hypothetical protein